MSMDLAVKNFSTAPQYFEAGTGPVAKTVKVAAEDIPAHAPVLLDGDGKIKKIVSADALDGLLGLTPDSIRSGEEGPVWLTGEFFADSLVLPDGVTAADVEIPLRNIGIFLK